MGTARLMIMISLLLALPTRAGTPEVIVLLDGKGDQLCQRIRQCAWSHLDADNLPDENRQALAQSLENVCRSLKEDLQQVHHLPDKASAEACIDSMLALSCDQLVSGSPPTPACQQLAEEQANR